MVEIKRQLKSAEGGDEELTFVVGKDKHGKLRMIDAFLAKGAMDLECPQCKRKSEPILFWYDDEGEGQVSRRYFYCCPNCKIHYTDWGESADWKSGRLQIEKRCKQNGDHGSERDQFRHSLLDSWTRTQNNTLGEF